MRQRSTKQSLNSSPLITYVVSSDKLDDAELSWFIDNDMSKALMAVEGVGEVGRLGGVDREIRVELNPNLLDGLGLTANDVNTQLEAVQSDLSGGKGRIGGESQSVRTLAAADTADQLRAIPIPLPKGSWVRLDELGTVTDTHSDLSSLAYLNGKPVIAAQIKRSKGYSDIAVTDDVRAAMKAFAAANPQVTIEEAYNTIVPTEQNYESSMDMIYEGALIADLRGLAVPARLARDASGRRRLAAFDHPHIPRHVLFRLHVEHDHAAGAVAGRWHSCRRCDRRNREYRAASEDGQKSLRRGDGSGRRDRPGGHCHDIHIGRGIFADGLHGRGRRHHLQAVRHHGFRRCSCLASRRTTAHADDGGLRLEARQVRKSTEDGRIMRTYLWLVKGALRRRWIPVLGTVAFLAFTLLLLSQFVDRIFPGL